MSSNGEFIVKFIANSVKENKNAIDVAKQEISEIDVKLQEAEKLKLRRLSLISVLEHFGDESHRRRRGTSIQTISEDIDYSTKEISDLVEKIKQALRKKPLDVRELIHKVGSYDQDVLIMRTVKKMADDEIIDRNKDNKIILL